jgi:hypothetical protein
LVSFYFVFISLISFRFVSFLLISFRTLPATQFKPGLLADKHSEVQMSYFYLCLSVCQYWWIIKFLEWAYRKKRGDMRGYFHRFGILRVHFSSDFITFFVCILHKFAYSQIMQDPHIPPFFSICPLQKLYNS